MPPTTIKNDGAGGSPLANLIAHSRDLRASSPVREYLSNNDRVLLAILNAGASKDYPLVGNVWSM